MDKKYGHLMLIKQTGFLHLVRTGAKEPKHDGISFLLIDMQTKGVSTKPITLISGKSPL